MSAASARECCGAYPTCIVAGDPELWCDDCPHRSTPTGFRVIGKHRAGCWGHEAGGFCSFAGIARRDKIGGMRSDQYHWFRFQCNDPGCEAEAIVRWDVLAAVINEGTGNVRA